MARPKRNSDGNRFKTKLVVLLQCAPCNRGSSTGEAATTITVAGAETGEIEPLLLGLRDSRELVVRLLTSLWSADDEFAGRVLDEMFPYDEDGRFHWPADR